VEEQKKTKLNNNKQIKNKKIKNKKKPTNQPTPSLLSSRLSYLTSGGVLARQRRLIARVLLLWCSRH
jgi:hypothetical protein